MLSGRFCCRSNIAGATTDLWTLIDRCLVKICDPGGLPEREINKDTRLGMCAAAVTSKVTPTASRYGGQTQLSLMLQA